MESVNIRDLGGQAAEVQKRLQQESELLVVSEGKPIAFLIATDEDTYEAREKALRRSRMRHTIEMCRRRAAEQGLDKMTMAEIIAEIKACRKEHREAALEGRG